MRKISQNLSDKCSQKVLNHAKQSATDALKTTSQRVIQNTVEATGDLIGNKISEKVTRVSKISQKNNSETFINDYDKKNLKKDIYLKKDRKLLMI